MGRRVPNTVPTEDLLRHMARFYSDYHIRHDLDPVLSACGDDEAVRAVEAYAEARRREPGYDPRHYTPVGRRHSSHQPLMIPEALTPGAVLRCAVCDGPFRARRSDARYCSAGCRKQGSRGRHVTDKSGGGTPAPLAA